MWTLGCPFSESSFWVWEHHHLCLVRGQPGVPTGGFTTGMCDIEKPGQFRARFGGGGGGVTYCSLAMEPEMAVPEPRSSCSIELGCEHPLLPVWVLNLVLWPFHRACESLYNLPFNSLQLGLVRILSTERHDRHHQWHIRVWGWGQVGY